MDVSCVGRKMVVVQFLKSSRHLMQGCAKGTVGAQCHPSLAPDPLLLVV